MMPTGTVIVLEDQISSATYETIFANGVCADSLSPNRGVHSRTERYMRGARSPQ